MIFGKFNKQNVSCHKINFSSWNSNLNLNVLKKQKKDRSTNQISLFWVIGSKTIKSRTYLISYSSSWSNFKNIQCQKFNDIICGWRVEETNDTFYDTVHRSLFRSYV